MEINITEELKNFVIEQEISNEKEKYINHIIGAFSEYIVATNPDYVYNKTYLRAFVDDFILCQKAMKLKYQILCDKILTKMILTGIKNHEYVITIDGTWKYENGKIKLNNLIKPSCIRRNKIQIEIKLLHENGFVVAEEINIDEEYDSLIYKCIERFIEKRKEILDEKTE